MLAAWAFDCVCVSVMCGELRLKGCWGGCDLWQILPALGEEEEKKGEGGG